MGNQIRVPEFSRRSVPTGIDYSTRRSGANELATMIEEVWADVGHTNVRCKAVPEYSPEGRIICYRIESNLKEALPPCPQ